MDKVLSIVIPVFNRWNFTKSCLNDLVQLPGASHQIILIDNASTDETPKEIIKYCEELYQKYPQGCTVMYLRNEENKFHSKACNQGLKDALGKYILFLNNDIRVRSNHSGWTKIIVDACDSTNGLVGPTMGQLDRDLNFVKEENKQLAGNSYLGGWCIAAREDTWYKLQIKDTKQIWNEEFPFYFNDTDLSFRARKAGVPLTWIDLPEVVHFGKISAAQINIQKLYKEGRQVFLKKWGNK